MQYYEGSGTYGHSCYDDVAQAAALLSQLAAKPVRLQFMRWDEHGWDNYGPAHVGEVRAAANDEGKIVAYEYEGWQHHWSDVETSEQLALGTPAAEWRPNPAMQVNPRCCGGMYDIPNVRLVNHHVPGLGYPKAAWLRSPLDLSFSFTSEQAIDQLAFLLKLDPYEFRRQQHQGRALAGRSGCGGQSGAVDAASGGFEPVARARRHGAGHWHGHASRLLWRGGGRDRDQQTDRQSGGEASLWRDRFRPGGESRQRREPDLGAIGANREPHVPRRSDVQRDQRHQPRLGQLSDPAFRRIPKVTPVVVQRLNRLSRKGGACRGDGFERWLALRRVEVPRDWGSQPPTDGELVAVELGEVVCHQDQPPLGPHRRSASSVKPIDMAVVLGVSEHGLDGLFAFAVERLRRCSAGQDAAHKAVATAGPIRAARRSRRLESGGISTVTPCSLVTSSMFCSFQ